MNVVVLISGRGSNLQAIVANSQNLYQVVAVISNQADALGLEFAKAHHIPTAVVASKGFSREAFDQQLREKIDEFQPDVVVLAGFMRILTRAFVQHYLGRLLNIHPSLLPKYKGLNTHQRALDAGDAVHGVTVHFVTPKLDAGPIIKQAQVPVLADDDEHTLAMRVLVQEHQLYPQVLREFAQGKVKWSTQLLVDDIDE
jgi:phosphoribosylglycinamide formyltransferase-1